jgi:hypothetical protein
MAEESKDVLARRAQGMVSAPFWELAEDWFRSLVIECLKAGEKEAGVDKH